MDVLSFTHVAQKVGLGGGNHEPVFPQIKNLVCILWHFTDHIFSYVITENDSRKLLDLRCIFSVFSSQLVIFLRGLNNARTGGTSGQETRRNVVNA